MRAGQSPITGMRFAMERRAAVFAAAAGLLLLGAAGYYVFARISALETQVAQLDRKVLETEGELQQAEARAHAASQAAVITERSSK